MVAAMGAQAAGERPRLFVLTDVSNEPDDEESLVRLMVYANEFDIEGLVATTSTWLKTKTREDLIRRTVNAYGEVRENLAKQAAGFPTSEALLAVVCTGQPVYGMAAVGEGKSTDGSRRLLAAADRADSRPLWVSVWGGANTLAQVLQDARRDRTPEALARLVAKLRVYSISDQDDAGAWIRREFPGLFYIVSPTNPDSMNYHLATWTGISGDRHSKNSPFHHFEMVDNPWLEEHVIRNHGPLGALYPRLTYLMEGDTPSFLGLINRGLGWEESPAFGGWGGRYALYQSYGETRPIWTNNRDSRDTVVAQDGRTYTSDQATLWRWREHFQNDFAARMNWCVAANFAAANHNPVPVLNGDKTTAVLHLDARAGSVVRLSAEGTRDPDGNKVAVSWWIYSEAGTVTDASLSATTGKQTEVTLPLVQNPGTVHVILQVQDDGTPSLFSYRRAVIAVSP